MTGVNPNWTDWILGILTTTLLLFEWLVLVLGMSRTCGFRVKQRSRADAKELLYTRDAMAVSLLFAVSISLLSSAGTLLRKLLLFSDLSTFCSFISRSNLILYGMAKVIIYVQLYLKIHGFLRVHLWMAKKLVLGIIAIGLAGFSTGILYGAIENTPFVSDCGICVSTTPLSGSITWLVSDWIISFTLIVCFAYPVVMQIRNPKAPSREIYVSVAFEQFILGLLMLVVSPFMISLFIYTSIEFPETRVSLASGTLPMVDLAICCYAQGYSSRHIWERAVKDRGTVNRKKSSSCCLQHHKQEAERSSVMLRTPLPRSLKESLRPPQESSDNNTT